MPNILTPLQNKFLDEFFTHTQEFYLTGGTALSAYFLEHRYSEDLDLFTRQDEAFSEVESLVGLVCSRLQHEHIPVRITPTFKHIRIGTSGNPVTLHFSREYTIQIQPTKSFGRIIVDSMEDITTNKICAALGRTELKDLIDLYFLHQSSYTIPQYFAAAQKKDGGLSPETLAYTFSLFKIEEIPDFMIKPLRIDDLKQFVEDTITWLIEKSAPPSQ